MRTRRKRIVKRLGEILIEQGLITPEQLEEALKIQRNEGSTRLSGRILLEKGIVNEYDILGAFISQYHIPYIPIDRYEINHSAWQLLPEKIARQYRCFPLELHGNTLTLLLSEPLSDEVISEIEKSSHCFVQFCAATSSEIEQMMERFYVHSSS